MCVQYNHGQQFTRTPYRHLSISLHFNSPMQTHSKVRFVFVVISSRAERSRHAHDPFALQDPFRSFPGGLIGGQFEKVMPTGLGVQALLPTGRQWIDQGRCGRGCGCGCGGGSGDRGGNRRRKSDELIEEEKQYTRQKVATRKYDIDTIHSRLCIRDVDGNRHSYRTDGVLLWFVAVLGTITAPPGAPPPLVLECDATGGATTTNGRIHVDSCVVVLR